MRMKKIMIVAVAVLTVAACSKTFDHSKAATEGNAIGFGTWAETLTKAAGKDAFGANDYFYVYGFNTLTGRDPVNSNIFDGVNVSTEDGNEWEYAPIRFWDSKTESYTFFAVSPSEASIAVSDLITYDATDVQDGKFTSKDRTFSGSNEDILVADKKVVLNTDYNKVVNLNFRHAAAKFDLKVRKGPGLVAANAVVKISKVELQNIQTKGHFVVSDYNAADATSDPNKANIARWNLAETPVTGTYTSTSDVSTTTVEISPSAKFTVNSSATGDTPYASDYLIQDLIVMPQSFVPSAAAADPEPAVAGQKLVISYEITTGDSSATPSTAQTVEFNDKEYDLILFDGTDYPTDDDSSDAVDYNKATKVSGWDPGVHYTYIITIDANAIVFSAQIQPWGDAVGGYYYLLN